MQLETIIYICVAGITALLIALFQYVYKSKLNPKLKYALFVARALTLFAIGLLLVNPKFESITVTKEKPNLVLAVDNSQSIEYLEQSNKAQKTVNKLINNPSLNKNFNIDVYTFGKTLRLSDSINFSERQSNISNSLENLNDVYKETVAPIVLISDGNQTLGEDYGYASSKINQPVYPIILGDTTVYKDLRITQLNVNRFAFLKNRFPVEAILNYSGNEAVTTEFRIKSGDQILFKKTLQFDSEKSSEIISTELLANTVGVRSYVAELMPLKQERNTVNNKKNFGVEIIDQKTNIALITERMHPDIGALKKSIESNKQRQVTILSPSDFLSKEVDYQLAIIYQPTRSFKEALETLTSQNTNLFYITGTTTDWVFLNEIQDNFKQAITNQTENFQPYLNRNYSNFIVEDLSFSDFPPLKSELGVFGIDAPNDVLFYKMVNGITTDFVLLATLETKNSKQAILNGEGIWRWRAHSYLVTKSFEGFDNLINKLVQFISSNKRRKRLQVDYNSFYNGNESVTVSAQYFNKSYEFDDSAALTLELKPENEDLETRQYPLLLSNGNYKVDLSGLASGRYNFTVKHNSEAVASSGEFEVLDYNVEQQFLNPDQTKLNQLAEITSGKSYFAEETEDLINNLLGDTRYRIVQKSTKNIVPLIDFEYLLRLIALSLFFEWFIRKYHGLI
ncbi:VWA domain-containing protein [uncultured Winogradskyella sp.]|uniref:VWA domain-containing protein n=1 Tax=uncultured Winogradskyella sp. TaxID=395353 RepID=UPI00351393CD